MLIIVTNLQTIGDALGIDQNALSAISIVFGIGWLVAMATLLLRHRRGGGAAVPAGA